VADAHSRLPIVRPAAVMAALEQRSRWILGFFCLMFLLGTCGRASQKLFWHDELFTLYMTRLPGLGDVWRAIADGAEASPPLFAAITRASTGLLGEGLITVRLPAIAGFLIASLAACVFVTRRCGPIYGLVACLLPTATDAYVYAYEARPYGIVLALAAIVNTFVVYDGESIWLEGLALMGLYCIIAASFWWG